MEKVRNVFKIVIVKYESKGPYGTPRQGRYLREMACDGVEWIQLA
jgi:hypothetical protein